jgi:hypothetical protein
LAFVAVILLFVLPLLFLAWQGISQQRIKITHRETYTIGFLWYGALPIVLSVADIPLNSPELEFWQSVATIMGSAVIRTETGWGFLVWAAFLGGCLVARGANQPAAVPGTRSDAASWTVVLTGVGVMSGLFGAAWALLNRGLLFRGYADAYDDVARGPLQGALVYTAVAFVIAFLKRHEIGRLPVWTLGGAIGFLTVLSLSVGTRSMPVLITIMLTVLASRLLGGLPRGRLMVGLLVFVAGFSALAAWRQGGVIGVRFAILTPVLEPLYTYISASTYLAFNDIPMFAFPAPLLGGLANLVPRALWPGKVEYIEGLMNGVEMFAPLGATHLFPSLLINFGWAGSIVAVFAAGVGIERLSRTSSHVLIASYALIAAVLTTDLWRNPFSQSLIKSVLQGAIIVPALLVLATAILTAIRASGFVAATVSPSAFPREPDKAASDVVL